MPADPEEELRAAIHKAVQKYADRTCGGDARFIVKHLEALSICAEQIDQSRLFWTLLGRMSKVPTSWSTIGACIGISRQAAEQRYGHHVQQAISDEVHGFAWWWRHDNGLCAACNHPMANASATDPKTKPHAKRQATLTTGQTVTVCKACADDPGRLLTIETEPMI